jgi:chromosome segregation ATPase
MDTDENGNLVKEPCNGTGKESPMSKIQRYRAKIHEHNYEPQPATMCLDEDVSKLEALLAERDAEIERLNEIIEAGFENLSKCKAENAQKDAEIERLSMDLHLKSSEVQQMKNKIDYVSVTDAENRVLKADNAELKKRVEYLKLNEVRPGWSDPKCKHWDCFE